MNPTFQVQRGSDTFDVEILPDGRVKITTDLISPAYHKSADDLIQFFQGLLGGETIVEKRKHGHVHVHGKGKQHA